MTEKNKDSKEPDFEEALSEIDSIVTKLEGGELSLDDSLRMFQRGMELVDSCSRKLDKAEEKLKVLIEGAGGEFTLRNGE